MRNTGAKIKSIGDVATISFETFAKALKAGLIV